MKILCAKSSPDNDVDFLSCERSKRFPTDQNHAPKCFAIYQDAQDVLLGQFGKVWKA